MAKKKVCVSFDFEHDKSYYYLLEAWNSIQISTFRSMTVLPAKFRVSQFLKLSKSSVQKLDRLII